MSIFFKKNFILLNLIIIFFITILVPNNIYAHKCCRYDIDCTTPGDVCYKAGTAPGSSPTQPNCSDPSILPPADKVWIKYCAPASPSHPDFKLPKINEIPELNNFKFDLSSTWAIGAILSALLPYVFAFSGFLLFGYLIYGAFTILSAMGEAAKIATGSKIITQALIGFSVLFVSYWLMQLLELVLGLNIL